MSFEVLVASVMRPEGETGVQTHFNAFCEYLAKRKVRHRLITPFSSPTLSLYPIFGVRRLIDPFCGPASVWWYRYWHYLFLRRQLSCILRDGAPRVVYAQCPLSAKAAHEARSGTQQRVVMVVHYNVSQADEWADKGSIERDGRLFSSIKRFEEEVLSQLDGVVFVSEFMKESVLGKRPGMGDVVSRVIPNFAEDRWANGEAGPYEADLISVGTLEPRKNQGFLLRVLAEAAKRGQRYTLTLVGDGPDRQKLVRLAQELGLEDAVRFAGFLPQAWALMTNHKAYVHAAFIENMPLTLIEAISAGLPVFAGPVGGVPEIFEDGVQGRYWPLDDPASAAEILIAGICQGTREELSAAARARFLEKFETSVVAARLYRFLAEGA